MAVETKICGVTNADALHAAHGGGARYIGFVFYPPSPRSLDVTAAAGLAAEVPNGLDIVGLFVDAGDAEIREVLDRVPLAMLQLHGVEPPDRVAGLRRDTGLPVMKAIKLETEADFASATPYIGVADRLLFDAKAPGRALPGGNAVSFDWRLLAGRDFPCPWMLSGGLDPDNVAQAIRVSGARAVDVSSGVERARGVKDPDRIAAFLAAVRAVEE